MGAKRWQTGAHCRQQPGLKTANVSFPDDLEEALRKAMAQGQGRVGLQEAPQSPLLVFAQSSGWREQQPAQGKGPHLERTESVTITRHGRPVARLVPVGGRRRSVQETIEAIEEFRKGHTLGDLTIRELIEEGRRH